MFRKSKNCDLGDVYPANCIWNNCTSSNVFVMRTHTKSNRYGLQHVAILPGNGICLNRLFFFSRAILQALPLWSYILSLFCRDVWTKCFPYIFALLKLSWVLFTETSVAINFLLQWRNFRAGSEINSKQCNVLHYFTVHVKFYRIKKCCLGGT